MDRLFLFVCLIRCSQKDFEGFLINRIKSHAIEIQGAKLCIAFFAVFVFHSRDDLCM